MWRMIEKIQKNRQVRHHRSNFEYKLFCTDFFPNSANESVHIKLRLINSVRPPCHKYWSTLDVPSYQKFDFLSYFTVTHPAMPPSYQDLSVIIT